MTSTTEFDVIRRYFTQSTLRNDVLLGVGDDCALTRPPQGQQLAITVDTLIAGVHFPVETSPQDIAYKSIAVNLSDLAAMGARPAWLTLALTLPEVQTEWLQEFSDSFNQTCKDYGVQLIGGDTTCGPLAITVQATGFVEPDRAMRRDAAKAGDRIYITGALGDAALGLRLLSANGNVEEEIYSVCIERLNRPLARLAFALAAAEFCSCAIDISDGLLADLGHILEASQCGADIQLAQIPLSDELKKYYSLYHDGQIDWSMVLTGGDDYELCLAASEQHEQDLLRIASEQNVALTCIGTINDDRGLDVFDTKAQIQNIKAKGYDHFA